MLSGVNMVSEKLRKQVSKNGFNLSKNGEFMRGKVQNIVR